MWLAKIPSEAIMLRFLSFRQTMRVLLEILFRLIRACFRTQTELALENVALRQQLQVLNRRRPKPRMTPPNRFFWVILRHLWSGWRHALFIVEPETVVRWHRAGFRQYWKWISRKSVSCGRKPTSRELRDFIFQMVAENRTWGAPRIHGELKMLGFEISERTLLNWMRKAPRNPESAKRWMTFLSNHRKSIAAMDFFTVPTLTFGVLYCFFVIAHDRRRILHFNVTRHPTSGWVSQQLRDTFPYDSAPRYLIFDHGTNFSDSVVKTIRSFGIEPKQTSVQSPWQNGAAERFVGSCRRDLLDHVIVLNERHCKRLMKEYVRFYHHDRTHLGLDKETPAGRRPGTGKAAGVKVISMPRLGGLHHRYNLAA